MCLQIELLTDLYEAKSLVFGDVIHSCRDFHRLHIRLSCSKITEHNFLQETLFWDLRKEPACVLEFYLIAQCAVYKSIYLLTYLLTRFRPRFYGEAYVQRCPRLSSCFIYYLISFSLPRLKIFTRRWSCNILFAATPLKWARKEERKESDEI